MEPIVIEDVPSSMDDEGMNTPFGNSFCPTIPIIEDAETPAKTSDETSIETPIEIHDETTVETIAERHTKTKFTWSLKEPPYPEQLTLQKAVE